MNDKLIKDFNKFQKLIKDLYENYNGEPFVNEEWNEFIKEGYNLFFSESEQSNDEDNTPCENYNERESGFACNLFCHFHQDCDGITCKKDCDYYNKRGWFK